MNAAEAGDGGGARAATTPAAIVDAALAIIDERGFDALSMRNVATRLGVFPTTLYWHVGNRTQLLGLVCERVLSDIELPSDDAHWRDWLTAFALRTRQVIGAHPRFAGYFAANIQVSARSLEIADRLIATLQRAGFTDDLIPAYNAVLGAVVGWISGEFATPAEGEGAAGQAQLEQFLAADDGDYPAVREAWPIAANRAFMLRWDSGTTSSLASSYELMISALLDGLERRLPR